MVLYEVKTDEDFCHYKNNYPVNIVMFTADYCNKCKAMEPIFLEKSEQYPRKNFLTVDTRKVTKHGFNLQAIPAFVKFKNGAIVEYFTGDDQNKLDAMLTNHLTIAASSAIKPNLEMVVTAVSAFKPKKPL